MIGGAEVFLILAAINVLGSLDDPAWATPVNTLLLGILAILAQRNSMKIEKVHRDVNQAASAAASAAECAATAARISQEIGAARRGQDVIA